MVSLDSLLLNEKVEMTMTLMINYIPAAPSFKPFYSLFGEWRQAAFMFKAAPVGTVTSSNPPVPEAVTLGAGDSEERGPSPETCSESSFSYWAREEGYRTIKFVVVVVVVGLFFFFGEVARCIAYEKLHGAYGDYISHYIV